MSTPISELPFNTIPAPTALPERDIPRETIHHTTDPQSNQNYMPPKPMEHPQYAQPLAAKQDYSALMEDMKIPILVAVLFFVFNMASVQNFIFRVVPSLKENAYVDFIKSALFGLSYYGVNRGLNNVNAL